MTAMPGSGTPTVSPEPSLVQRFSRTERALHWLNASAFFGLLAGGLVLYVPAWSEAVSRRGLVKTIHLYLAIAWLAALLVVVLAGGSAPPDGVLVVVILSVAVYAFLRPAGTDEDQTG